MYEQSADAEDVIDNYAWLCTDCGFELCDEDGGDPDNWQRECGAVNATASQFERPRLCN
jgi:hypothetical protein